jgi:hypothetical protein
MSYLYKTFLSEESTHHDIIKANAIITIYNHLNQVCVENDDPENLVDDQIKFNKAITEDLGLTPHKLMHIYLDFA